MQAISVRQLNMYIGRILSTDPLLQDLSVRGEVTKLTTSKSGHLYLTLSDGQSRVSCFLPKSRAFPYLALCREGEEVIVTGSIHVYNEGGSYSILVKEVETVGQGDLQAAFELLKEKLDREGLFAPAHKKKLPPFPKHIAIVTSRDGAAIHDILKIIRARTRLTNVTLFPVLVQGKTAGADIAATIRYIDQKLNGVFDLLITGRGGGSPEDLACFNEEEVARAIYDCRIPVISAVGHEIDVSIADFVADARAETPTAAAEMAVPSDEEWRREAENQVGKIRRALAHALIRADLETDKLISEIKSKALYRFSVWERDVEQVGALLRESDPNRILQKGYALLLDEDTRRIPKVSAVHKGRSYQILMQDGKLVAEVKDITRKEEGKEGRKDEGDL